MENEDTYSITLRNRLYTFEEIKPFTFDRRLQKDEINIIL